MWVLGTKTAISTAPTACYFSNYIRTYILIDPKEELMTLCYKHFSESISALLTQIANTSGIIFGRFL